MTSQKRSVSHNHIIKRDITVDTSSSIFRTFLTAFFVRAESCRFRFPIVRVLPSVPLDFKICIIISADSKNNAKTKHVMQFPCLHIEALRVASVSKQNDSDLSWKPSTRYRTTKSTVLKDQTAMILCLCVACVPCALEYSFLFFCFLLVFLRTTK